jgi:hypothetical protein
VTLLLSFGIGPDIVVGDSNAVSFAEGLPAESLVPGADPSAFGNGGGAVRFQPDFHSLAWEADGYAPLVATGPVLDQVRARLAEGEPRVTEKRQVAAR